MGTKFMEYVVKFAKDNKFSEIFLTTDYNNPRACHVYEKVGFKNETPDEVCYVYEVEKKVGRYNEQDCRK